MSKLYLDVLVNLDNPLGYSYVPDDLVATDDNRNNFHGYHDPNLKPTVSSTIYIPYIMMKEDACIDGLQITIDSGYRSAEHQRGVFKNKLRKAMLQRLLEVGDMDEETFYKVFDEVYSRVALPGCSEHQTGYAFDIASFRDGYYHVDSTPEERAWLNENAYKYGFILRYPKGKEDITKFSYEPWHYRYVGKELSKELYNYGNWVTLEEYHEEKKLIRKK